MRKETKNGVTYTFETDDLTSEAVDVDVQPGIEYLILECKKKQEVLMWQRKSPYGLIL